MQPQPTVQRCQRCVCRQFVVLDARKRRKEQEAINATVLGDEASLDDSGSKTMSSARNTASLSSDTTVPLYQIVIEDTLSEALWIENPEKQSVNRTIDRKTTSTILKL